MLLDGVGGPQIGVKGGLDFAVDTSANPWWTLTAPVSIEASLTAPALDLKSGSLTLFSHTFNIANAGGPLHPPPPPPPPSAQARHITNYQSTQDLACTLNTAEDSADEFYTSADSGSGGAPNDACGTFMSLDGTLYGPATIPARSNLGTYEAWTPVDQTTSGSGSSERPLRDRHHRRSRRHWSATDPNRHLGPGRKHRGLDHGRQRTRRRYRLRASLPRG